MMRKLDPEGHQMQREQGEDFRSRVRPEDRIEGLRAANWQVDGSRGKVVGLAAEGRFDEYGERDEVE